MHRRSFFPNSSFSVSWLFPLYLAGAAAVIVPVLLHLRRRPPQDRVEFSSLLFLDAQRPVPVSKRRLENWLLLALRCLALLLLALMFSRPFWQGEGSAVAAPDRAMLILIDRSASMRRADLWPRAVAEAEKLVREAKITDRVAVAVFDREVAVPWGFDEDRSNAAGRLAAVQARLQPLSPGWHATHLDRALGAAGALFDADTAGLQKSVHLITDLQEGSRIDALRSLAWPAELKVSLHRLDAAVADNLSLALAAPQEGESTARARLSNTRDSAMRDFTLAWEGGPADENIRAQMPPGASRILPVPPNSTQSSVLMLKGDAHDFDNRIFVAPPQPRVVRLHFLGPDAARDEAASPLYYLSRALQPTPTLAPQLTANVNWPAAHPDIAFIAGSMPAKATHAAIKQWLEAGGFLVLVPTDAELLTSLTGAAISVSAVEDADYRMLAEVKTEHPLLKPFADPKLRDFTKLRFWKHRHIVPPEAGAGLESLARFDNGHGALWSARIGKGTLLVMASGWHPADSQLALSTKFVPLLYGWLSAAGFSHDPSASLLAGDALPLDATLSHTITDPSGVVHELKAGQSFTAELIGLHRVKNATHEHVIAVNLPPEEGRVLPMDSARLAEHGVKLAGDEKSAAGAAGEQQRLTATDTEQRQHAWWWVLVALLAVLLLETLVAGRRKTAAA